VKIDYFFEGLDGAGVSMLAKDDSSTLYDFIASPDGLALASAFSGIEDQTVRRRIIDLIRVLAPAEANISELQQVWDANEAKRAA